MTEAKLARDDEFYTRYVDVENELKHYAEHFKDKVVYCNCDDAVKSNFAKYFIQNFNQLGLKRLEVTGYGGDYLPLFEPKPPAWHYTLERGSKGVKRELKGNGEYNSDECESILKGADVVVTNPPFSLFRDFITYLEEFRKKYLVIGNIGSITYTQIFPLIKAKRMWLGITTPNRFTRPDGSEGAVPTYFYTNLQHGVEKEPIMLKHKYTPEKYPKYDNYDAIEVSKISEIPYDYDGVMGVPATIMMHYNTKQFVIVGLTEQNGKGLSNGVFQGSSKERHLKLDDEYKPPRVFVKKKQFEITGTPEDNAVGCSGEGQDGKPLWNGENTKALVEGDAKFKRVFIKKQFEPVGITDRVDVSGLKTKKYTSSSHKNYADLNANVTLKKNGKLKILYSRVLIKCKQYELLVAALYEGGHGVENTRTYKDFKEIAKDGEQTGSTGGKIWAMPVTKGKIDGKNYYSNGDEEVTSFYKRLFIKKKREFEIVGKTDRGDRYGLQSKKYSKADASNFNELNRGPTFKKENGKQSFPHQRLFIKAKEAS